MSDPTSPSRTRRPRPPAQDVEAGSRYQLQDSGLPSPGYVPPTRPLNADQPATPGAPGDAGENRGNFGRKRSLIRPERTRINRDHPNYHYRQHAAQQGMNVLPSTTGNDPIVEDIGAEAASASSDSTDLKSLTRPATYQQRFSEEEFPRRPQRRLTRKGTVKGKKKKSGIYDGPPSLWTVYCRALTFWAPNSLLKCFGKVQKEQQRAWREKIGLVSLVMFACACVGFLTFGFTQVVCGTPTPRLKINHVNTNYLIIHGVAYDLSGNVHPPAPGVPRSRGKTGADILYDLPIKYGGMDASFMFQNVNGHCKGLIEPTPNSEVVRNSNGDLAWYFPCVAFKQDGSSKYNQSMLHDQYNGWACHTSAKARNTYYGLKVQGDVYFTWDDLRNQSRSLTVYSGDVLDLDLLNWFNTSQIRIPEQFKEIQADPRVKGVDITHMYQTPAQKKLARCLQEIIRVGSVDTETVGCIASKVVLYVSLVFIVSIVMIKFVLALFFGWFLSWKLGAERTKQGVQELKARRNEIEDWSEDIYRAPPKLKDAGVSVQKRGSFLPTTSRFTSPYSNESVSKRSAPTTFGTQTSSSRLVPPSPMYQQNNGSSGSLNGQPNMPNNGSSSNLLLSPQATDSRLSQFYSDDSSAPPMGFIHDMAVAQPDPKYQPFNFPLAHAICLVTCYSEGEDGIRTTLDSVATTDYPNSHKVILVICDGMIKGHGETRTTPDIVLDMMQDHLISPDEVNAYSYVAVASGAKRHNMAKVYAGYYSYGKDSRIPPEKQQRVPMILLVKCGTPDEAETQKAGNRGKRDSQIILMSFLQKVMFDERMTELEFELFNGIWRITGVSPDFYEMVLMVDADTKVFPDSLTHMIAAMVHDPQIMGLCGETKIANKRESWVSMIQVFEYFISHHLTKAFESVFGGVTCLPGCFCMYRIKAPKGGDGYWVPILANPDIVEHYSENVVETLHTKNLLLLGEDRYLSTLMLKTFPKRKQIFVPQAVCKTTVPAEFKVLLSQRRRWINSTVHNLMELVLVRDLCGTFCFSMQFVVFIELIGTTVLPAAIAFTVYLSKLLPPSITTK